MKFYPSPGCLALAVWLALSGPAGAQAPSGIVVQVAPQRADWVYPAGAPALFSISVLRGKEPLRNVAVHVEVGPEKMPPSLYLDTVLKRGTLQVRAQGLRQPGFLRCVVTARVEGRSYRALATAAYDPGSIRSVAQKPADFDSFWQGALHGLQGVALDPRLRLLTDRSTAGLNVYEVSWQTVRQGARAYGVLCVPVKPGRYPAVLKVPGAGVRPYPGDTALAAQGVITLEMGIHGIPVTLPSQLYYDLAFGPLHEYYFSRLDDRDRYYYKRVYLSCVRAVDFLCGLSSVDTGRLAVYGGSQGGALAIVTAALDRRIRHVVALYPALSDLTGYLHGRAGGWPHMFAPGAAPSLRTPETIRTSAYYDVANFAPLVRVPGLYSWGFNDEVCPPTSLYATYNRLPASRELFLIPEAGHWLTPAQEAKVRAWLLGKLQVKS